MRSPDLTHSPAQAARACEGNERGRKLRRGTHPLKW
uniref:Uncharacterized protein n=1 Tax=Anguilla anguilla TaxID=7936 RepID=A0A0E9V8J1_ANGAN